MDKTNGFDTEENPMTTILVTGASGFIGSRVVKKMLADTICYQKQDKMHDKEHRFTFKLFARRQ
jgi:nucleoside-diphosphate-sugar epimerase